MASRPSAGLPTLSRRGRVLIVVGVVALALLIIGARLLGTYVDWLWFGEVGFRGVFTTVLFTRLAQLAIVGVVVGGLLALNLVIAYRTRPVFVPVAGPEDPLARYRTGIVQRLRLVGIGVPVAIGLIAGLSAMGSWQTVQLFFNGTSFGIADPVFGYDIGFYAFSLPFYQLLLSWAFVAVVLSFIGALVTHYLFGGIRLAGRGGQVSGPAKVQLGVLAGVFVLLKGLDYFLDRYALLSSDRGAPLFNGASYTDLNAVMPAKIILMSIAVICAIAFFAGAVLRNLQLPAIATVLLVLSGILVGAAWPALLQQFSVSPNANEREATPIARNIEATRQAYGITDDKVDYVGVRPGQSEATPAEVREDSATISNIRLLDPNILEQTFTQLQQRENFFGFPDKLDIDRYRVNGEKQDHVVALRELETSSLAENQRTWINQHLRYTHGNGFVAAPANVVQATGGGQGGEGGGYPRFTVSDTTRQGDIPVEQPRVYFGELIENYVIVGGEPGEPPREYDSDGQNHTYQGEGGVPIGGWFNRMVFAAHHGERNILFNRAIGSESKIIYNQDPRERVEKAAPWLTADGDPYPAVVDGRIKWIVDGYTTLENYPYAQQTVLGEATQDTLSGVQRLPDEEVSYIRNSVKATVDAYDGTVTLYQVDQHDPVLQAWMNVFPGTVEPASEVSDSLRQHFRYPEDLFKVQRQMLARYHVDDPAVFFSQNNFWDIPSDPTERGNNIDQPPYYIFAGPPDRPGAAKFQLTSALTSLRRDFLGAYVSVSSDPENYGEMTVLELPTDSQTLGPQQVQTRFDSEAEVSRELNLLRQSQTDVLQGNLLTLPVAGGGFLYVEPIYVERANQDVSFPQLNRVLTFYGDRVGYGATLAEALDEVFGAGAGQAAAQPGGQQGQQPPADGQAAPSPGPPGSGSSEEMSQAVADIKAALDQLRQAQQSGDFAGQGQALERLDAAVQRYQEAQAAANGGGGSEGSGAGSGGGG